MSRAARRLQRRGQPVVGERLVGVAAHYRNPKGDGITCLVDFREANMDQLYRQLADAKATKTAPDVAAVFARLDTLAARPIPEKIRFSLATRLAIALDVHWLECHGHLAADEYNGMQFTFTRRSPTEPGQYVGFMRETLDPTSGQETAFARAVRQARDGQILRVPEDE